MIEVFNRISQRLIKALMLHQQYADMFDMMDLHGFKRQQEYQYLKESVELLGVHRYAINHLNKMINDEQVDAVREIPSTWYNATRLQVDSSTRKQYVKDIFEKWFNWETESKAFFESQFKLLTDNSKIAEANKVNDLIQCVDKELKYLTRQMLEYKAVDYDMSYIMFQQDDIHEKYKAKEKELGIDIC